jgi:hypothetical protein
VADTEVTWRGLTLGGDSDYIVNDISGWEDMPELLSYSEGRARGHGEHVGDLYARGRTVTVSGKIADVSSRNELARALQAVTVVSSDVEDLNVDTLGILLTAGARVVQRALPLGMNYSVGEIPFAIQWRCPDPLRYGPDQYTSTGLAVSGGGLTYPLAYPLSYGVSGSPGRMTLINDGTADAPIRFGVTGPLLGGFELSSEGRRLTYLAAVPAGQIVEIDTGTGKVVVEDTADRRTNLIYADWLVVPAGGSLTVQFTSLNGVYDAAALAVAGWRSASW